MTPSDELAHADLIAALPRLRRFACILTGDASRGDDLVLEILARARSGQRSARRTTGLLNWLFTVMHDVHHRRSTHPAPPNAGRQSEPIQSSGEASSRAVGLSAKRDHVLACLARLEVEEREVLVLVAVEQLSYGEVARLLGVPTGTVLATLARARHKIRNMTPD